MAKILDLRNAGGQLVIIGDSIAVPTSNSTTFSDTSPRVAGSLRYNPDINRVEFLSKNSLDWLSIGGIGEDDLGGYVSKAGDTMSGTLTMTGTARMRLPDGSTSSPAVGFVSATTTGFTLIGGALAAVVGGTTRVLVSANTTTLSNNVIAVDGSATTPAVAFAASSNSGVFYTANTVNISVLGNAVTTFAAGYTSIPQGSTANPGLAFSNALTSGFSHTSNTVSISVGGSSVASFNTARAAFPAGTASNPGVAFATATTTGMSQSGSAIIFSIAGTERARVDSSGVTAALFSGTATAARYADLAERYHSDAVYTPGTVLILGGNNEVTIATTPNDSRLAGVVSTAPGYMLNSHAGDSSTHPYVALRGRVPCKVIGPVKKGDILTTSAIPGYAMKSTQIVPGSVIGKALADFNGDHGLIEVMV